MVADDNGLMSRFRRAGLGSDFGYTPGEQPPIDGNWLKLNTNESPLPPSPMVAPAVLGAVNSVRRYPSPAAEPLRSALAQHHDVSPEQVMVVNGGDQVLDCCFRAFTDPGERAAFAWPTYSLLPVLARLFGVEVRSLPLSAEGQIPPELGSMAATIRFLVNPNAPTGIWMAPAAVEELLGGVPGVVVIDEAYADFAPASVIPRLAGHPNWVVLRTFSKGYALAGLRVGYAIAHPELIADLRAVADSYPVDSCAIAGAQAALGDRDHHARIIETVRSERDRLTAGLHGGGWDVLPSQANFVFGRPPDGDAAVVQARLRDAHVLVRRVEGSDTWGDRLRITVGTAVETDRLFGALGLG